MNILRECIQSKYEGEKETKSINEKLETGYFLYINNF